MRSCLADGLEIGLVTAEPQVAQPLSISFDDRGRMWVLQYRQFPNPNGLTPVKVDNWLRTKYDRIPDSLTWGPDGWRYGAQGSTATAEIRGIGFQQGVWRYHPRTKEFELFAEGGGNTWGIDFDRFGNLFAGGNTVEPLVHHVQGAYYVKGFGKHGPLHNPHSYGYFRPVKHHGYAGDSLTGGFVLYQGGAFPERFNGHCIAPNTRHSASRWSTVEVVGSTFATRAAGDFITTSDIWFRPVDSTVGPDGALYVADWYDYNISHSSPKNRSQWYQPSCADGRVWRVAPAGVKPIAADHFDLSKQSNAELIKLLSHPNDWYARQARRLFAERRDTAIVPALEKLLDSSDQRLALQALWSIFVSGGFDDALAEKTLNRPHKYVRAWTVRLLGDAKTVSTRLQPELMTRARDEASVVVRSQLACTVKRLPADAAMPIIAALIRHDEDVNDAHVPLLLQLIGRDEGQPIVDSALSALTYFDDQRIARKVRSTYPALKTATRARSIDLLCSRPAWALELLEAVEKKELDATAVTLDQVRQLLVHDDEGLRSRVTQTWGRVQPETPLQLQGRISAVTQLLNRAKGDAARGLLIYEKTCAACHKLHGKGTVVGPDLTGAERKDRFKLIRNIIDPSSEIRPQFISHVAVTTSGRVLTGLLADSNADTITLLDVKNKRTVLNRSDLEELRESTVSLMPEKLLDELTDQQIRDLLAYVQSDGPGK